MGMHGELVEINGTRLYVYDYGDAGAAPLLYLHGGPAFGCHEFVHWQGEALGNELRLIAFDQRGAHHSDPVDPDAPITEDILVEDCEALREQLGFESWHILGHSFGGRLATRYAARYPQRIRSVLFDGPAWDAESTERYRMPVIADIYAAHGRDEQARACREWAARADMFADGYNVDLLSGLDELDVAWYLYDRSAGAMVDEAGRDCPNPEASSQTGLRLLKEASLFENLIPLLTDLEMPTRLIIGEADLVTSPDQVEEFKRRFGPPSVEVFERAGHFPQGEQPERYTRFVLDFIAEAERQRSSS
jgi:proline iminopeptidase